jgi:hypothetical protein
MSLRSKLVRWFRVKVTSFVAFAETVEQADDTCAKTHQVLE